MSGCKPWPFFFALAVGSQISPRLRRNVELRQNTHSLQGPDLSVGGLEDTYAKVVAPAAASQVDLHVAPPKSPPHAAEVSPSDEWEKVDYAAGVLSDEFRGVPKAIPQTVSAPSCEAACLSCMQVNNKKNFPDCTCFATCRFGGAGSEACERTDISWSNDDPTTASELWEGKCQEGKVSCSDCLSKELVAENDECRGDLICMHKLHQRISDPMDHPWFCSKLHISDCESFTYKPKENGWTCYATRNSCEQSQHKKTELDIATAYEESPEFGPPDGEILSPCVWCTTSNTKDGSKPAALQVRVDDVNVTAPPPPSLEAVPPEMPGAPAAVMEDKATTAEIDAQSDKLGHAVGEINSDVNDLFHLVEEQEYWTHRTPMLKSAVTNFASQYQASLYHLAVVSGLVTAAPGAAPAGAPGAAPGAVPASVQS